MSAQLKRAFDEASKLSEVEQDAVARWLLDELRSERRWDDAFADSREALGKLAAEAIEEHRTGRTRPLDPKSL